MNERRVKYQPTGREKELFYTLFALSSFTSFSPTSRMPQRHLFFFLFFIEHLSSLLEITYRVERACIYIHLHSFSLITHHLLTPVSNNILSIMFTRLIVDTSFSESTLPRRQIPAYRLQIYICNKRLKKNREFLFFLYALHFFFCLNQCCQLYSM